MESLEKSVFRNIPLTTLVWWPYIAVIFMVWEQREEKLKRFLENINCYHPTIKSTVEYSRAKISFLDVTIMKNDSQLAIDLYVLTYINVFILIRVMFGIIKK